MGSSTFYTKEISWVIVYLENIHVNLREILIRLEICTYYSVEPLPNIYLIIMNFMAEIKSLIYIRSKTILKRKKKRHSQSFRMFFSRSSEWLGRRWQLEDCAFITGNQRLHIVCSTHRNGKIFKEHGPVVTHILITH